MMVVNESARGTVRRELLEAGFYFDALDMSPWMSNKDIIRNILVIRRRYRDDKEMEQLLLKAQSYLTAEREKYEGEILPCMDYIRLLLGKRYGNEAEEAVIKYKLLKVEEIERRIKPPVRIPEELRILFPEDMLDALVASLRPNLHGICEELLQKIVDLLKTSEELKKLKPEINTFIRNALNLLDPLKEGLFNFLFSLPQGYKVYIRTGPVSEELKNAFKEKNQTLSGEARVKEIDKERWEITDGKKRYIVIETGSEVNIFEKIDFDEFKERINEKPFPVAVKGLLPLLQKVKEDTEQQEVPEYEIRDAVTRAITRDISELIKGIYELMGQPWDYHKKLDILSKLVHPLELDQALRLNNLQLNSYLEFRRKQLLQDKNNIIEKAVKKEKERLNKLGEDKRKVESLLDIGEKLNEKIENLNLQEEALECMKLNGIAIIEQESQPILIPSSNWEHEAEDYIENVMLQLKKIEEEGFPVSPMEAVIRGAAIYGGQVMEKIGEKIDTGEKRTPYGYGYLIDDNRGEILIPAGSPGGISKQTAITKIGLEPGESISLSLLKSEDTPDGKKYYKIGNCEFFPIVGNIGANFIPILEMDKDLVVRLTIKDRNSPNPPLTLKLLRHQETQILEPIPIDRVPPEIPPEIMQAIINDKKIISMPLSEADPFISLQILIPELKDLKKKLGEEIETKKMQMLYHYEKITDRDVDLRVIRSRNKGVVEKTDKLIHEISQLKIEHPQLKIEESDEALSSICSKNEAAIDKINQLLQELSQLKEVRFLSGLFGIISGVKKKVSMLKDKSLNLVKEVSPEDYNPLKTDCSNLSERELIFAIDQKLGIIRSGLENEIKAINKLKEKSRKLKEKVSKIKKESLNLLEDFSLDDFQNLKIKCSNLSDREVISIIDEELLTIKIKNKLKTELDEIDKVEDLQAKEKNVVNLTAEGEKLISESCLYKKLKDLERDTTWITLNQKVKQKLISGDPDGKICVFDLSPTNIKPIMRLERHGAAVNSLVIIPNYNFLASAGAEGQIILFNLENGEIVESIEASKEKGGLHLLLTQDGKNLISGGADGVIRLWKLPQLELEAVLEGHKEGITCLSLTTDGKMLISSDMSTIFIWDFEERRIMKKLKGHIGVISCLALSPDTRILAVGESSLSSKIILWDLEKCRITDVLEGHQGSVEWIIFGKDGDMLISRDGIGNIDNSKFSDIFIWNLGTGKPLAKLQGLKGSEGYIMDIAIDDNEKFLIGGDSNGILVWDLLRVKEYIVN